MPNATLVKVNPSSGDDYIVLKDKNGQVLSTVSSGTILKVRSDNGETLTVDYESDTENKPMGGSSSTGVVAATPYTNLSVDPQRRKVLSRINNGTPIEILDENLDFGVFKVSGRAVDGDLIGWIEFKYVFRALIKKDGDD